MTRKNILDKSKSWLGLDWCSRLMYKVNNKGGNMQFNFKNLFTSLPNTTAENTVRCNMCWTHFVDEYDELELMEDNNGYFKGCPTCKTDNYLMDLI